MGFDTLYVAAQVPLPIRNRNQGQIEAAAAELKAAELFGGRDRGGDSIGIGECH